MTSIHPVDSSAATSAPGCPVQHAVNSISSTLAWSSDPTGSLRPSSHARMRAAHSAPHMGDLDRPSGHRCPVLRSAASKSHRFVQFQNPSDKRAVAMLSFRSVGNAPRSRGRRAHEGHSDDRRELPDGQPFRAREDGTTPARKTQPRTGATSSPGLRLPTRRASMPHAHRRDRRDPSTVRRSRVRRPRIEPRRRA